MSVYATRTVWLSSMRLRLPCRNVKTYREAQQSDGILLVRIDAPIYFANIVPIRDALR